MSKDWKKISTINDMPISTETESQKNKRNEKFKNATKLMKVLDLPEMKKRGDESYAKKVAADDHLLDAFERKTIKNKDAIKLAIQIKKDREKEAAKQAKKEAKAVASAEN